MASKGEGVAAILAKLEALEKKIDAQSKMSDERMAALEATVKTLDEKTTTQFAELAQTFNKVTVSSGKKKAVSQAQHQQTSNKPINAYEWLKKRCHDEGSDAICSEFFPGKDKETILTEGRKKAENTNGVMIPPDPNGAEFVFLYMMINDSPALRKQLRDSFNAMNKA